MTCSPKQELTKIKVGNGDHQYAGMYFNNSIQKPLGVVGLNPSLFKNGKNNTVNILMHIAAKEGFDSLFVTNLYSYISPDPRKLKEIKDPVGKHNDQWIEEMSKRCEKVLCIWGNGGAEQRVNEIMPKIRGKAYAIGLTKSGQPRHVLHTKKDTKLIKL